MLYEPVASARRVLVFDAIDFGLPPGTLRVLRDGEVPAWGRTKLSPHQTSFNDVLALAQMNGRTPGEIVAIGVQPVELNDFGGSLRPPVQGPPARGRAARGGSARGVGLSGHAARAGHAVRTAERRPAGARPPTSRGVRPRPMHAATAIRGSWRRSRARATDMCIGVPMQLVADGTEPRASARAAASARRST